MQPRTYLAIDLKSFYASVECVERGLDPLTTNLVVADQSRTDKTMRGGGSPARWRMLRRTGRRPARSAQDRCCNALILPIRGVSSSVR